MWKDKKKKLIPIFLFLILFGGVFGFATPFQAVGEVYVDDFGLRVDLSYLWDSALVSKLNRLNQEMWDKIHADDVGTGDKYLSNARALAEEIEKRGLDEQDSELGRQAKNALRYQDVVEKEWRERANLNADEITGGTEGNQIANIDNRIDDLTRELNDTTDTTRQEQITNEINSLNAQRGNLSQEQQKALAQDKNQCFSLTSGIHFWFCALGVVAAVANLLLKLFGVLLWISSSLFDLSVYFSIIGFKSLIQAGTVDTVWRVMRDLANLTFIFILLYIAIGVIFDLRSVGANAKKMIVDVIIIALLVNFSGFIVRVVVDASNVVAYEFYSRMSYDSQATEGWADWANPNIGTALVSKLDLGAHVVPIDGVDDTETVAKTTRLGFLQIILGAIGGIIIILMASFVLLAAAIMFMIRMIVLLLVYIFSPLALVCRLIPGQLSRYEQWKTALLKQSFYAPAFMIPLFGVFAILGQNGLSTLVGALGVGTGLIALTALQIIVMGLVASCIFIAQKFGAVGVGFAQKWSGKTQAMMTRYGATGVSAIGKRTRKLSVFGKTSAESWAAKNPSSRPRQILSGAASGAEWLTSVPGKTQKVYQKGSEKVVAAQKAIQKKLDLKGPAVPSSLLAASDYVSSAVSKAKLGKDFNIMGSTKEERKKTKDDEKQKKQTERRDEINEGLRKDIKSASENPPTPDSFLRVREIVQEQIGDDKGILKLIDMKPFTESPEAACALKPKQLSSFAARNDDDFAKYKTKIRDHILHPTNETLFGLKSNRKEALIVKSRIWQ